MTKSTYLNAGNLELVQLLVKRKADVASKNKSGKTAADLARDSAVKEVLNEAGLAAFKPEEDTVRSNINSAERSGHQGTADVHEPVKSNAQANVEIGPPERPDTVVQDDSASPVSLDVGKQPTVQLQSAQPTKKSERQAHSQTNDPESSRPFKLQKVALSFAEEM